MNNKNKLTIDLDKLTQKLINENEQARQLLKGAQAAMLFLGIAHFTFLIINPNNFFSLMDRISGFCTSGGLILLAIIYINISKKYKNINYNLPTLAMLKQAAKRYQLVNSSILIYVIPIALINIGLTIACYQNLTKLEPLERIFFGQGLFWGVSAIGVGIAFWLWYNKTKPMIEQILAWIYELEG